MANLWKNLVDFVSRINYNDNPRMNIHLLTNSRLPSKETDWRL